MFGQPSSETSPCAAGSLAIPANDLGQRWNIEVTAPPAPSRPLGSDFTSSHRLEEGQLLLESWRSGFTRPIAATKVTTGPAGSRLRKGPVVTDRGLGFRGLSFKV